MASALSRSLPSQKSRRLLSESAPSSLKSGPHPLTSLERGFLSILYTRFLTSVTNHRKIPFLHYTSTIVWCSRHSKAVPVSLLPEPGGPGTPSTVCWPCTCVLRREEGVPGDLTETGVLHSRGTIVGEESTHVIASWAPYSGFGVTHSLVPILGMLQGQHQDAPRPPCSCRSMSSHSGFAGFLGKTLSISSTNVIAMSSNIVNIQW